MVFATTGPWWPTPSRLVQRIRLWATVAKTHHAAFAIDLHRIERDAAGEVAECLEPAVQHAGPIGRRCLLTWPAGKPTSRWTSGSTAGLPASC